MVNRGIENDHIKGVVVFIFKVLNLYQDIGKRIWIVQLPAKILYYVSDEFNKICKNVFLYASIQIAERISR